MKKFSKSFFHLMMFLLLTNNIFSQQITFSKIYNYNIGSNANSVAYSVQQTSDTGYVIAGKVSKIVGSNWNGDLLVIKTDKYGDTLWTKTYGDSLMDWAQDIQKTSDGGYIVAGRKDYFVDMDNYFLYGDIWILKLDANGDTLWTKTYGGPYCDYANSIKQTSDGGYIVAGIKNSYKINYLGDIWILKLDQNGDTLWTKTFHFSYLSEATSIIQTAGGAFVFTGTGCVAKLSNSGDSIWYKNISSFKGNDILQAADSSFIAVGFFNNSDDKIIKLDSTGNVVVWENLYPPAQGFYFKSNSVALNLSGDIITAGQKINENDIVNLPDDLWIKKNQSNGDTVWTKIYDLSLHDIGYSIKATNDNGYIIAGTTNYYAWLIKLNGNGDTLTSIQENRNNSFNTWNYPNPFSYSTSIYFEIPEHECKKLKINIFNSTGTVIKTIMLDKSEENHVLFEATNLPSGVYYYKINTENISICKKMVLIK